jgi:hypothetical protein
MSKDYYSKANPLGPYAAHRTSHGSPGEYIEGQSTPKNIKEWSARAASNSGPKIAPGDGRKTAPTKMRGPLPAD